MINDDLQPENLHVVSALWRCFHEAKLASTTEVIVWASGKPMREFLYVDDMGDACIDIMDIKRQHDQVRGCGIQEFDHYSSKQIGYCKGKVVKDYLLLQVYGRHVKWGWLVEKCYTESLTKITIPAICYLLIRGYEKVINQ